jgi:hypothetical protein
MVEMQSLEIEHERVRDAHVNVAWSEGQRQTLCFVVVPIPTFLVSFWPAMLRTATPSAWCMVPAAKQKRPAFRDAGLLQRSIGRGEPHNFVRPDEIFSLTTLQTWQRPTLPRLRTEYHRRWGVSRPSSEWDRVQPPRHNHQVGEVVR